MNKDSIPPFVHEAITALHDPVWQAIVGGVLLTFALAGCRVFAKAGFHPLVGLLFFVPIVNIFLFLFLAFSPWPVQRELRELRGVQRTARDVDQSRLRRAG